jgi:alpha,alpha-trehalase
VSTPPDNTVAIDAADFDAVIFDMDGVVTDTAQAHARAWKQMFDDFLQARAESGGDSFVPFDIEGDYLKYVDGKPRFDGAKSFFESRGIHLPDGSAEDDPEQETVWGLSMRKQGYFLDALERFGAKAYDSTLALIDDLRAAGIATAIITASKNREAVLEAAGVGDVFDAAVDGLAAQQLGLQGKPAPDVFLEAARRVDAEPPRAVVVEDAQAGVAAGRAGGFGLVIGVDRAHQRDELARSGADAVVVDLAQVAVVGAHAGTGPGRPNTPERKDA